MFIDTHCHINSQELRLDASGIITRARSAGVAKMVIIGCDFEDSCEAAGLAHDFGLYASVGIHPHEAKRYEKIPEEFNTLVQHERVVAVGEIGLDYHYDHSPRDIQKKIFDLQLRFAREKKMPVVLHIRDAMNEAMPILRNYFDLKLLFHCYSGGLKFLDEVLELKGMCAFGGALTWKGKAFDELREVFKKVPAENILLETDSPYMTPVPFRGKLNEPAYIKYIYEAAAEIRNIKLQELEEIIADNAKRFFNF
ncbi:MAG: TatD family hydrolase [Synergistaceae bacterium]|nr:TatD family hydrolase [Synergistaceae bacterium]